MSLPPELEPNNVDKYSWQSNLQVHKLAIVLVAAFQLASEGLASVVG
jgi:hypothetical protein